MSTKNSTHVEFSEFAQDIARRAGKLIMNQLPLGRWRAAGVEHKTGRELVSVVDRASEEMLTAAVRTVYPQHGIFAEEGGSFDPDAQPAYRWLIDPLDGTTNFLYGHPLFAVSLAVQSLIPERDETPAGSIVAAVVYLPYLDETYSAVRGAGAVLNSETIQLSVSPTSRMDRALVATGFAYERDRYPNYDNFVRVAHQSRGIRRCGAASVDLAFVAAGRYDAFWELGLKAWDVAAGSLLVQEAGGRITDLAGGDSWLDGANILATNGRLHEPLQQLLDPYPPNAAAARR